MALVAITDHVFADLGQEREMLAAAGHELRFGTNAATPDEVARAVESADAVLNCYAQIPPDLTRSMRGCRIIARYGIGLDTIDVDAATSAGIIVTNVPDYCIDEVSDHALALVLALGRGVARLDRAVRAGRWSPMDAAPLHRLRGRTLGLVGFGRIAQALATKAGAVGLRVVAHDPFVADEAIAGGGAEPPRQRPSAGSRSRIAARTSATLHPQRSPDRSAGAVPKHRFRESAIRVRRTHCPPGRRAQSTTARPVPRPLAWHPAQAAARLQRLCCLAGSRGATDS